MDKRPNWFVIPKNRNEIISRLRSLIKVLESDAGYSSDSDTLQIEPLPELGLSKEVLADILDGRDVEEKIAKIKKALEKVISIRNTEFLEYTQMMHEKYLNHQLQG